MKTKSFIIGILILASTFSHAATNDLSSTLQRGLFEEEANRNLEAAAQAYQTVSSQFDKDRALAATAIFRLGEIYRKQNKTNEAAAQYERIVREFADQDTLVTLSRQNLAGIDAKGVTPVSPALTRAARLEQKRLMKEEIKLVEQDWADLKEQRARGVVPQSEVRAKEREILKLQQQVAALDVDMEEVSATNTDVTPATDDEEKEIRRIQEVIRNSPDLINAPSGDPSMTPLCRAARNGHLRVAKFLLNGSAAVDRRSSEKTPLQYAASGGHRAMTEFLLQRGADVNARDGTGRTALHVAAENGFQAVAEALVIAKADIKAITSKSETPLILAAGKGHAELVRFLIANDAPLDSKDDRDFTAVTWAARRGNSETLVALLDAKAKPDVQDSIGRTPLSYAAEAGHLDSVKALLAATADPNAGKTMLPLHVAIHRKTPLVVEALLRADADANRSGAIDWQISARGFLYGSGGSFPSLTPLFLAIKESNFEAVKLLLQFKADAKGVSPEGTPLIYSVLDQPEILKAFLEAGADPNQEPKAGRWPPLAATQTAASVALLLAKGANIENQVSGRTPLLAQAEWGSAEAVAALLKGGANVQARKPDGQTALHMAASARNTEMVSALLAHKADVNARDKDGLTSLDLVSGSRRLSRWLNGQSYQFNDGALSDKTAALLREHGGLSDLPKVDCIEVRRTESGYSKTVFSKGTNDWNQFTLLDALFGNYFNGEPRLRPGVVRPASLVERFPLFADWKLPTEPPFPDLHRIVVVRPSAKPGEPARRITADLLLPTGAVDCTKDLPLEFGDVVEIPEREHTLQENPTGFTAEELLQIARCREQTVGLLVRGKRTELKVAPWPSEAVIGVVLSRQEARGALFSSSDLSRVKVTRRNQTGGKPQEWIIDCSSGKAPDLWLRDGDVIEVPDKL